MDQQESKRFFFEKKKQKTFMTLIALCGDDYRHMGAKWIKVFWFFFSKKNIFLAVFSPA
jgi:hypothetical protein